MHSIKEAMKAIAASVLKEEGFSTVESRALELLSISLLNYTIYTAARMKAQAEKSRRASPTLVDASTVLNEIFPSSDNSQQEERKNPSFSPSFYSGISLPDLLTKYSTGSIKHITVEEESFSLGDDEFISKACTQVEYPQNYYEFFPKFPPAHTFKNSTIKRKITDDRAQKARLRNEQTKKIVENLFTIMMKSGKSPKYANYLL